MLLHVEPPPNREPFFAPGGLWVLGYAVTMFVVIWFLGDFVSWAMSLFGY